MFQVSQNRKLHIFKEGNAFKEMKLRENDDLRVLKVWLEKISFKRKKFSCFYLFLGKIPKNQSKIVINLDA